MRRFLLPLAALMLAVSACSGGATVPPVTEVAAPATSASGAPASASESETAPSPTTSAAPSDAPTTSPPTSLVQPLTAVATEEVAVVGLPVDFALRPGDDRVYIVDKAGRVVVDGATYLDISDAVSRGTEQGLLGLVWVPGDPGRFFVDYTDRDGDTVVEEFVDDGSGPVSVGVRLRVAQPAGNHNGGSMVFDEEGRLYLGLGDGGAADDRFGNGQNDETLLGSILRFRVSAEGLEPDPDNAFTAPEIWAIGVRNPWRLAIDGDRMYVPDVGQNRYEEATVVPLADAAPNLGWPRYEGLHCFDGPCETAGLTMPVVEVPHGDAGACSITGGVVYRGSAFPEWQGAYFYSDFCGGFLRSFDGSTHADWTALAGGPLGQVTVIGVDDDGELLVGLADGRVLRLVPVR